MAHRRRPQGSPCDGEPDSVTGKILAAAWYGHAGKILKNGDEQSGTLGVTPTHQVKILAAKVACALQVIQEYFRIAEKRRKD